MLASVSQPDGPLGPIVHAAVEINHGVDGWVLVDMEWDPNSGQAVYDYVQYDERGRFIAAACAIVRQPCTAKHDGWAELWNKPELVFGMQ